MTKEQIEKTPVDLLKEALRSGHYDQTQNTLRDENGFCCLGVACDISGLGRWEGSDLNGWEYVVGNRVAGNSSDSVLPVPVKEWLGFEEECGSYKDMDHDCTTSLMDENDSGTTFAEIAEIIDSKPKGLFKIV